MENCSVISGIDFAIAKFLVDIAEINNDDLAIEAMSACMTIVMSKRLKGNVNNIVIFGNRMCVNAEPASTIESITNNKED